MRLKNGERSKISTHETLKNSKIAERTIFQQVLEVAEEFIRMNKTLDARLLFSESKKRLKSDRKVLLQVINHLLEQRILVEGSKLTREMVLFNSHRKKIFDFINTHAGANFSMIKKTYEGSTGSPGQLLWHLQMLIKFNYINKVKHKKYTLFIPINMKEEVGIHNFLLRDELNKSIINLLREHGPIKRSEIYKHLEESREKIYYRINTLMASNIIAFTEGSDSDICITQEKKEEILKILNAFNKEGGT